jgi:uncharacterized membrane protein
MSDPLTIIWYAAATLGVVAVIVSFLRPPVRRPALLVAATAFAVAGVLGILSIGVVFLVAAAVCGVAVWRYPPQATTEGSATT